MLENTLTEGTYKPILIVFFIWKHWQLTQLAGTSFGNSLSNVPCPHPIITTITRQVPSWDYVTLWLTELETEAGLVGCF